MLNKKAICRCVGLYKHALTRGKVYEVFKEEDNKYRIQGNHGKRLWIDKFYFNDSLIELPILDGWKFDDDVTDPELNFIEVTLYFKDGSRRWCTITTPEKLIEHFKNPLIDPPGFNMQQLIIVKSLDLADIERTLRDLDNNDGLISATKPLC